MKINSKAQTTLFIIIGILLLVMAGLIFYVSVRSDESIEPENNVLEKTSLQQFIDGCIKSSTDEGLEIMRMQAGYIDIPASIPTYEIMDEQTIIERDGIKRIILQPGINEVPYYIHNNNIIFPNITVIETQLKNYIEVSTLSCIDDFRSFRDEGYEVDYGQINASVGFANSVVIDVDFPITLTRNSEQLSERYYTYDIPINFLKMYETAKKLVMYEFLDGFVENHILRLIALYGFNGEDYAGSIPPTYMTVSGFQCPKYSWQMDQVDIELKNLMQEKMAYLKIARTNFTKYVSDNPVNQGVYDSFIEDLLDKDLDLHVDITFDKTSDINLDIKPRRGNNIEPDEHKFQGIIMLPNFCTVDYDFKYSLKAPVLFNIESDINNKYDLSAGRPENNFTFRYAIETLICGNNIRACISRSPQMIEAQNTFLGGTADICENKNSGQMSIEVIDAKTSQPINDADIYYYCGSSFNDCKFAATDNNGRGDGKLPFCTNGIISIDHQDYFPLRDVLDVKTPFDVMYQYSLVPKKHLNISISLIKARDIALAYMATNGFKTQTCNGTYPQDLINQISRPPQFEGDNINVGFDDRKNMVGPSFSYPSIPLDGILIPPSKYDVSMSYLSKVRISPSTIEDQEISFNPSGGDYVGVWALGNIEMPFEVTAHDVLNSTGIHFYMPISHFPDENLDVNAITKEVIGPDGFISVKLNIPANSLPSKGCSHPAEEKSVWLTKSQYIYQIMPRFYR